MAKAMSTGDEVKVTSTADEAVAEGASKEDEALAMVKSNTQDLGRGRVHGRQAVAEATSSAEEAVFSAEKCVAKGASTADKAVAMVTSTADEALARCVSSTV